MKKIGAVLLTGVMVYLLWPSPRPAILSAYTDSFAGSWALTLYKDGKFQLSLPGSETNGRFHLMGDTVELQYAAPIEHLPAAYLINRPQRKIDELQRANGKWIVAEFNNWAALQLDSTQYYGR
ncbi:hypothetical protein HER32_13810 [Hymenobacter sp. BT18]|uniref:hypothetical protein n=1 Tax=Hymenobacter sp. BT18 TaxID=2835648 RepID=UPI00143E116E|nr:hypothetical protein [Hymenobacter sp. BT18]QIX62195.1 hypothetical protein HER32_13810 [Hymenobacter sp. BT18]